MQKEIAISPLILNVSIPYMDMHLSTMLECEKSDWFLSECNISCSLLTTVTSNICMPISSSILPISVALFLACPH